MNLSNKYGNFIKLIILSDFNYDNNIKLLAYSIKLGSFNARITVWPNSKFVLVKFNIMMSFVLCRCGRGWMILSYF